MIINETLKNGIRVIGETMEHVRSCAVGVWVATGSVNELENEGGISHFIEHMLFKGTEVRSAQDIAAQMDGIGGNINAFTSKECTCYYVKVLDEHLPLAVDILSDIVLHSKLDPEELKKEQGVVCEEILMTQDSPEDLAHETISSLYYQDDPLARPILGTEQSVRSFTRESLQTYMKRQYIAKRVVVAAAGHFDKEKLLALITEKFQDMPEGEAEADKPNQAPGGRRYAGVEKDIEQVHICLALPGTAMDADDQYPLFVLNNTLGGSMSSRLFQKIREERGMAYSIYSYPSSYKSAGAFSMYAGTGEKQAPEVIRLILEELAAMRKDGITEQEFKRSQDQLKGSYVLAQEGTSSRMNALGKTMLLLNREYDEKHTLGKIEAVTRDDVVRVLEKVLDRDHLSAVCVGRVKKQEKDIREALQMN
ncbi:insulinase family protein [Christensenellaceae bacterium OttesenSCG-928-M15]|nr:insulinase family protein [Christensenellaceae bacterium OttesenSCG-928-M15]